jgi:hypothetical protein
MTKSTDSEVEGATSHPTGAMSTHQLQKKNLAAIFFARPCCDRVGEYRLHCSRMWLSRTPRCGRERKKKPTLAVYILFLAFVMRVIVALAVLFVLAVGVHGTHSVPNTSRRLFGVWGCSQPTMAVVVLGLCGSSRVHAHSRSPHAVLLSTDRLGSRHHLRSQF